MKFNHSSFENGLTFDLIMRIYQTTAQNVRIVVQKPPFFVKNVTFLTLTLPLKLSCRSILGDLGQDIMQIIFKLVVLHEIAIDKAKTLSSFALEAVTSLKGVWGGCSTPHVLEKSVCPSV